MGIEPTPGAWEAHVLPLNYARLVQYYYRIRWDECQTENILAPYELSIACDLIFLLSRYKVSGQRSCSFFH